MRATKYKPGAMRTIRGCGATREVSTGETVPIHIRLSDGDITNGWRICGFDVSSRAANATDDDCLGKICTEERPNTNASGWAWESNVEIAWASNQVNAGQVRQETGSYWDKDVVIVDDIYVYLLDASSPTELVNYMIRLEKVKIDLNTGLAAVVANKAQGGA